jgi:trk system potassium uptake protein TrkH
VVDTGDCYTGFGRGTILALIQIGGLGLITFTAFFALLMRKGLGMRETLIARSMVSYEGAGTVTRTLRQMIGITFLVEGTGAALLFLTTRAEFASTGKAVASSVFHSISAFCNAGFSLYTTNLERFAGNVPVNLIITTLIVVGGLGFPVLMNLIGERPLAAHPERARARWSVHSRLVLIITAILLAGGTLAFLVLERNGIVFASITSMFGGRGRVELFRRRIPERVVREALVIVAMGILVVTAATFVLLITEKRALSDVLFEVVSAFGTVGLSTGLTPGLTTVGKAVLILVMLTGRIGPLTLALAIGQRGETPLYDYPEARVLVG